MLLGGMILIHDCGYILLRRVALTPDPTPGPDGQLPLMSAIHDGYHSTSGKAGPIISSSRFVGAGKSPQPVHLPA